MRSVFLRCVWSVSLVCGSLQAVASPSAHPTPAQLAAIRRRMDQSLAITELAKNGIGHALRERVKALAPELKDASHLVISGTAKHGIAVSLSDGKLLALSEAGTRPLGARDLRTHEIFDQQELRSLVEAELDKRLEALPAAQRPVPAPRQMRPWELGAKLARHPDASLLTEYHRLVLQPRFPAQGDLLRLAKYAHGSLALRPREYEHGEPQLIHLDAHGAPHANQFAVSGVEDPGPLKAMGYGDEAAIEASLERAVIAAAHRGGIHAPSGAAARTAMKAQIEEAQQILKWLNRDGKQPPLSPAFTQLVIDARVEKKGQFTPMSYQSRVMLGESDEVRIDLVGSIYISTGDFYHYAIEAVPHAKGGTARPATLADLHASGLGSWSQIEHAAKVAAERSPKAHGFGDRLALLEALRAGFPDNADLALLRSYQAFGQFPLLKLDGAEGDDLVLGKSGALSIHDPASHASFARAPRTLELERRGITTLSELDKVVRKALIAHAGLKGDPSDDNLVAAARKALHEHMETAKRYLAQTEVTEDPTLLAQHQASEGGDARRQPPAFLAQAAGKYLTWKNGALRTIPATWVADNQFSLAHIVYNSNDSGGQLPAATYGDLVDFGLPDQASFDAAMLAHMARAGHLGDPAKLTLTEARRALAQQIKDAPHLVEAIAGKNADAIRLLGVYQHSHAPAPGKDTAAISLVSGPEGNLVLGDEGWVARPVLLLNGKAPTIGQLRRMGVGTMASLEALLHEKMFALARDSYH